MTKGDLLVERGAQRLQALAEKAAARGDGVGTWLSEELRTDAAFLRKLKPSLVTARAKGEAPTGRAPTNEAPTNDGPTNEGSIGEEPAAAPPPPPGPPRRRRASSKPKKQKKAKTGGPPPIVIVGAAFVVGIVLAKVVDWRGHAHPRD